MAVSERGGKRKQSQTRRKRPFQREQSETKPAEGTARAQRQIFLFSLFHLSPSQNSLLNAPFFIFIQFFMGFPELRAPKSENPGKEDKTPEKRRKNGGAHETGPQSSAEVVDDCIR